MAAKLFRLKETHVVEFEGSSDLEYLSITIWEKGALWEYYGKFEFNLQSELFGECFTIYDELENIYPKESDIKPDYKRYEDNKKNLSNYIEYVNSLNYN